MDYPFVVAKSHTYLKPKELADVEKWLEAELEVDKVYRLKNGDSYRIVSLVLPKGTITPQTTYFMAMERGEPLERYHTPLAKGEDGKVWVGYIDKDGAMFRVTGVEFLDLLGKDNFVVEDPPEQEAPAYLAKMAENMKRQLFRDAELEKAKEEIADDAAVKADLSGKRLAAEEAKAKAAGKQKK